MGIIVVVKDDIHLLLFTILFPSQLKNNFLNFILSFEYSDKGWQGPDINQKIKEHFRTLKPFMIRKYNTLKNFKLCLNAYLKSILYSTRSMFVTFLSVLKLINLFF